MNHFICPIWNILASCESPWKVTWEWIGLELIKDSFGTLKINKIFFLKKVYKKEHFVCARYKMFWHRTKRSGTRTECSCLPHTTSCSALPQSLLHAPRGGDEVLHTQTRPDQSYAIWMVKCVFSEYTYVLYWKEFIYQH